MHSEWLSVDGRWRLTSGAVLAALALCLPLFAGPPKPAAEENTGALILVGGGKLSDVVRNRFLDLAGGKQARIVLVPTASSEAETASAEEWLADWKKLGPTSVTLLHTRNRLEADSPTFVKPLAHATGVWLSGGDQSRLAAAYQGTAVETALQKVVLRGGVVGGTSAGAAVMTSLMIAGGNPEAEVGRGLDLLPGFVVDQHFLRRNRVNRLLGVLARHPGYVGLGIDEQTAVIVQGGRLTVIGQSYALLCSAGSAVRPVSIRVLKEGDGADINGLRRAAQGREPLRDR
jgi:cyanophycinase